MNATTIKLVIADMAGTTIDFGSLAPAGAFVELFRRSGLRATLAEARKPMGQHKRDHIRCMLAEPAIIEQHRARYGRAPTEADVEAFFHDFIPLQLKALPAFCTLIPGVEETVHFLRRRGVKFATSTGYNREMTELCLQAFRAADILPDFSVCAAEVPQGRPAPWMVYRAMEALLVPERAAILKIGDTIADVEEGRNAGCWSVGVSATGNMLGLEEAALHALAPEERAQRLAQARGELLQAGAHEVVESFAELPDLLQRLEDRLHRGEQP